MRLIKRLPLLILCVFLAVPIRQPSAAEGIVLVVEEPQLHPTYTTCPDSYWYPFSNNRGHMAYLTLNAFDPAHSTNYGEWHPVIPQSGYYLVEAYIPSHPAITWCTGQGHIVEHDTNDAHYSIHHAKGATARSVSQTPLSNQWLNLGEYYFNAGQGGYVNLTDLNGEADYTTTISFSAMRFTYTRSARPQQYLPMVQHNQQTGGPTPGTGIVQAQGFDSCHLPALSEMQTWWNQSPYSVYALYLGGISLLGICNPADAAWVKAANQQGWSFLPTWVGPQAPCSGWSHKMSADPGVAYTQGRAEAEAASGRAAAMGLTSKGGTIIYYDLEVYGGASLSCRQTAASFINGWVQRLHELGNLAGGYGARYSYVTDWPAIPNIPDDIWAASWYTDTYDVNASVYSIPWLNGFWTNHQRIRQYAGDHTEKWGEIKLTIDSDVADGMVALPPSKPLANPIVTSSPAIEDTGWISADEGWLVAGEHLYWTSDQGGNWQDITPGPVQRAYILPTGQAWALSSSYEESIQVYHASTPGEAWQAVNLTLPPDEWNPLQLKFISPSTGWMVLKKATSPVFDYGILIKTSDGGLTWQTYPLPVSAPIEFTSPSEGWLVDINNEAYYHTTDGGLTWQPVQQDLVPLSQPALPQDSIMSGWQANGLGWSVTYSGACSGDKYTPGFACQVVRTLWQTLDGGQDWQPIKMPTILPAGH